MGIDARLFIRYRGNKPTDDQLKLWSWDLCTAIGAEKFFISPDKGRGALELTSCYENPDAGGTIYQQDGPDIVAEPGEWFIEANLWSRYYGEGYERGDWQTIINTALWLEQNIGGEVWYGGDSSGIEATPFGKKERDAMTRHALSESGKDYFKAFSHGEAYPTPEPCGLCVKGRGMTRFGWGANYVAVSCAGCGRSFNSHDNGKTWNEGER